MFVLYGTQGSGAAAVEAALEYAGAAFHVVDAASWKPGPGFAELLRVNPLGQIPTLVLPDGSVMTESAAILGGERIGALDLLAAVVSRWSGARKHLATTRPAFRELLARIDADPAVTHVFARHWPAAQ